MVYVCFVFQDSGHFSKVPNVSFQEGFVMMVHNRKVGEENAFSPKKSLK